MPIDQQEVLRRLDGELPPAPVQLPGKRKRVKPVTDSIFFLLRRLYGFELGSLRGSGRPLFFGKSALHWTKSQRKAADRLVEEGLARFAGTNNEFLVRTGNPSR